MATNIYNMLYMLPRAWQPKAENINRPP